MEYTYNFEKLQIWQDSRKLVVEIFHLTATFPSEEKFGLVNQLRRAAVSIPSNIAEGSSRTSRRDQARFVEIAYGSICEVVCQLTLAFDLGFINEKTFIECKTRISQLSRMVTAYKKAILKNS